MSLLEVRVQQEKFHSKSEQNLLRFCKISLHFPKPHLFSSHDNAPLSTFQSIARHLQDRAERLLADMERITNKSVSDTSVASLHSQGYFLRCFVT